MTYLDHAATTPVRAEVIAALCDAMTDTANPSSLHTSGRRSRRRVEEARERLAAALGARPSEVIFTSGGTEADNLAVKGIYWARRDAARAAGRTCNRVVLSAVEHHAVLDSAHWLAEHDGAELVWLEVDSAGRVRPETLAAVLADDPESIALISVMWANNEVGTVQPIAELAGLAAAAGVPLHTDAVQAVGAVEVSFAASGVSALSVTAHKLGGPVGVGALLLRRDVSCVPLLHGGGQERDVRSGTLDVAGVTAFALATELAVTGRPAQAERLSRLRERLVDGVRDRIEEVVVNGGTGERLPGIVHLSFPGCEGDSLLMLLDAREVECSTGSACSAGVAQPSHVLLAMGADEATARSSLRFSLGHTSTEADVDAVLEAIGPVVDRARRAGMASGPVQRLLPAEPVVPAVPAGAGRIR